MKDSKTGSGSEAEQVFLNFLGFFFNFLTGYSQVFHNSKTTNAHD